MVLKKGASTMGRLVQELVNYLKHILYNKKDRYDSKIALETNILETFLTSVNEV